MAAARLSASERFSAAASLLEEACALGLMIFIVAPEGVLMLNGLSLGLDSVDEMLIGLLPIIQFSSMPDSLVPLNFLELNEI